MPLIAYAWLWHVCIYPIPKFILVNSMAIIMFIIFPLIKVTRNLTGDDKFSFTVLREAFLGIENPIIFIINEMGESMRTVALTLQLVPSVRDFDMGISYIYALLTIFPNLFWDIHPTIARGLAANWLVWTVDPSFASSGGGLGYSFIAEAYLNFGWFGSPIILAIIGYLFAKFTLNAIKSQDPAKMAMVASFISFFFFYARGESGSNVRPLIWYSFFPYACVKLSCFLACKKKKDCQNILRDA